MGWPALRVWRLRWTGAFELRGVLRPCEGGVDHTASHGATTFGARGGHAHVVSLSALCSLAGSALRPARGRRIGEWRWRVSSRPWHFLETIAQPVLARCASFP